MEPQHGDKLDNDLSGTPPKPSVEVICVNDHTFKIQSDQVKTTETGKSAIAFCPVCGQPARVTKRNVGKLFGFKANDTKAFNATLKRIRATQLNTSPEALNAPPQAPDLSRGKEVEIIERGGKQDDEEYEAEEEEAEFGGEKIRRYRVRDEDDESDEEEDVDEDESEDDEGDESEDDGEIEEEEEPPRRKPRQKPKRRIVRPKRIPEEDLRDLDREARRRQREDEEAEENEEDEEESFEDRVARNRSLIDSPRRRPMIREEEFDPNKTLKEIIAESGLDEFTVERLFDYIDMQPEGWQPAQVMGMLDPWMSRSLAQRLVARYQAELYREKVRNEKEQQMMQMIGPAAGNIRLGTPGINQPIVTEGGVMRSDPAYASLPGSQRYVAQDPRAYVQRSGESSYSAPRTVPRPPRTGMTDYEAREIIAETVAREVGKFQQAMLAQQREDALKKEIEELRRQVANPPRPMAVDAPPHQTVQDKYMENQNQILTMLLKHALEGGKSDLTGALLTEIRDLKKSTEQSLPGIGGANKASDLKDIVELQRLSNDINIAKMEFEESVEGKKFTKDLIEGALQQIGQTIAQVVATRQPAGMPSTAPGMPMMTPGTTPDVVLPAAPVSEEPKPEQPSEKKEGETKPEEKPKSDDKTYNVTARAKEGKMEIPCPTCGAIMTASPGDVIVTCPKDPTHQFSLEPPKEVVDALTGGGEKPAEETPRKGQVY